MCNLNLVMFGRLLSKQTVDVQTISKNLNMFYNDLQTAN